MEKHNGKIGSVEAAALAVVGMVFLICISNIYYSQKKDVDSSTASVTMCPVEYIKSYTEIGTVEYTPKFMCEE